MNKILLVATVLSFHIIKPAQAYNNVYLKAAVGANYMRSITDTDENNDACRSMVCKSKPAALYLAGVGTNLGENLRAELTFEQVKNPVLKGQTSDDCATYKGSHQGYIRAMFANLYLDLFDIEGFKLVTGAGVGIARVKERLSGSVADLTGQSASFRNNTKSKDNLSYQLSIGASKKLESGITFELLYTWRDYGKTGSINQFESVRTRYKGNNVLFGIRLPV